MIMQEFMSKLQLLKIRAILQFNQMTHRRQLNSNDNTEKFGPLKNITKYLSAKKISLQLYKEDEEKKEYILELIGLLGEYGIEIELIEFEQIFNNNDIKRILGKNPNIQLNLRYMIKSYFAGKNVEMTYGVNEYSQILDKIEYFGKVARANFKNEDEQVMFVITQLAGYISIDEKYKQLSEEQVKETSSLKGALLERKTVCIGYAMALERCLTNLGIGCKILIGIASRERQENLTLGNLNHAWNQVKLNDKWYNVDLIFFEGSGNLNYILVDDKTFEGHYAAGEDKVSPCYESYSRCQEVYEKVKNIKNVLVGYDSGKRDMMLQYDVQSNANDTKSHEKGLQVDKSNAVEQGEEK